MPCICEIICPVIFELLIFIQSSFFRHYNICDKQVRQKMQYFLTT